MTTASEDNSPSRDETLAAEVVRGSRRAEPRPERSTVVDFIVKAFLATIIAAILIVGGLFVYGAVTGYHEPRPSAHQAALERQEQESPGGQGEP